MYAISTLECNELSRYALVMEKIKTSFEIEGISHLLNYTFKTFMYIKDVRHS